MSTLHPLIDQYNELYWKGLQNGKLQVPQCRNCSRLQFPMGPCCSGCLANDFEWRTLSGRGVVYAYVVYHHAFHPAFKDALPYNVAEIMLEEGIKVISNVVGIGVDELRSDMPVRARFFRVDDELSLLKFEPVTDSSVVFHAV